MTDTLLCGLVGVVLAFVGGLMLDQWVESILKKRESAKRRKR